MSMVLEELRAWKARLKKRIERYSENLDHLNEHAQPINYYSTIGKIDEAKDAIKQINMILEEYSND